MRTCIILPAVVLGIAGSVLSRAEEAGRYLITSSSQNIRADSFELSGDGWSVRKRTLRGGRQEGVELVTIDNGVMEIDVIPTRGMSIFEVRSGDLRLGWDSPVEEIVHPSFVDLESRGGLGWLEGFNEWMVRCGLEFAGHPGTDEFVTNTGDTASMDLTLHGKIGNIPASEVEVVVEPGPSRRIRIRGTVYEKFFYGPKLRLVAEVSVVPGESSFRIDDAVTNLGSGDQEFTIIYHANFGPPLLGEGSVVEAAAGKVAPMNGHAAESIDRYATYAGPTEGFIEEVYLVEPLADSSGRSGALLRNAAGDRAVSMHWAVRELPYLTIWKNTAATGDGYVTGIEPATGYPYNRSVERAAGRLPKLAPGAARRFGIEVGLHRGAEKVEAAVAAIDAIRGGREPLVQREPPKAD